MLNKIYTARTFPAKTSAFFVAFIIAALFSSGAMASIDDDIDQMDGTLSGEFPHIPEPMVFDLVRPLGTTKGELEINALARYKSNGDIEWAPEIEYAVMDGLALELELPFENSHLDEYKMAIQGTLPENGKHFIHGWQVIGRYSRATSSYNTDALYLADYRFNEDWSCLNMLGSSANIRDKRIKLHGLMNMSLFYSLRENMVLGLELNNEFNKKRWMIDIIPQLHTNLNNNLSLQIGGGPAFGDKEHKKWTFNSRLIYSF